MRLFLLFSILIFSMVCSGCGYGFQGRSNPWEKDHVRKLYVKIPRNVSQHAGAEAIFTSALIREFTRSKRLEIVNTEEESDAILTCRIDDVHSDGGGGIPLANITKDSKAESLENFSVFSEYNLRSGVTMTLVKKKGAQVLWSQSFAATHLYPGNNRFGLEGSTSMLINASRAEMAYNEVTKTIASDVQDVMLEAF